MKSLIIVHSYHHNNTLKIAKEMANVLSCDVLNVESAKEVDLNGYDVIGFGAGIDSGKHYKELLVYANDLENEEKDKKCFIFSTSAVQGEKKVFKDHLVLRETLVSKDFNVLSEFSCKGFNTNLFLKYIGGMNKKHPDGEDLKHANQFAVELMTTLNQ